MSRGLTVQRAGSGASRQRGERAAADAAHTAAPRLKERSSFFLLSGAQHFGAPTSGRVSHQMEGLSNRHGVPGVPGEEILTNGEFIRCQWSVVGCGFGEQPRRESQKQP
jgi:hypothetical protein